jgi:hypothetical protein
MSAALIGYFGLSTGPSIGGASPEPDPAVRIGVYDNRPIAIAFGHSEYNPVWQKLESRRQAAEAGDDATVAELNAWGESFQRRLHFQGFGRYPVDDLLAHVEDQLPALAERLDLDAIVWICDYHGPAVETVDVTADLVALFGVSDEQALEWTTQIRDVDVVDLDTLVGLGPDE